MLINKIKAWYDGFLFKILSKNKEDVAKNPYLQGNYAPIKKEITAHDLPIVGKIPTHLNGIYMRNGPNPAFDPISYTYPIDGDGMLHAVYIQNGRARYKNRFVLTKGLLAERKAGRALYGGISKPIPPDPRLIGKDGDPGPIKNGAFIHIIRHAGQYLAMYEAGSAYEIDAELKTIGQRCPKNATSPFNVNAHTRLDPRTGELFAFTYDLKPPYLRYYILDKKGNLTKNFAIEKSHPSMMHDFVLTENYVVFFDCPAIFNLRAARRGNALLNWKPDLGVNIIIVNRSNDQIIKITTEPFFVYHFANAFEKENTIIVDYVKYEKLFLGKMSSSSRPPMLYRSIIDCNTKTIKHHQLDDHTVEFPRINAKFNSNANRYIYLPTQTKKQQRSFNQLMKYDLVKQEVILHDFGDNKELGEAVFLPAKLPKSEDDGYVGLFVYDKADNKSDFVLLNAQAFADNPLATIQLPQRVPHGLHGSWMSV